MGLNMVSRSGFGFREGGYFNDTSFLFLLFFGLVGTVGSRQDACSAHNV